MKKIAVLLIMCLPLITVAQESPTGIQWSTGLTWEQVVQKAREKNKYIFLDCFTTWCGPCKKMDKNVYINDTVGSYMNDNFISVKVQMDKTDVDDVSTKNWYEKAVEIQKQYRITGFPTYIFLSPKGEWIHKSGGYQSPAHFVETAQNAIKSQSLYADPNEEYYRLIDDYRKGRKDFSRMLFMLKKSKELNNNIDLDVMKTIRKEYKEYLAGLPIEEWYSRENVEFLATTYISKTSPFFRLFYEDGSKIDAIMKFKGYAAEVVQNTIYVDIVTPFFKDAGYDGLPTKSPDSVEANWDRLYSNILQKYNTYYAERSVLDAKLNWYDGHKNAVAFYKSYILFLNKYGIGTFERDNRYVSPIWVNERFWNVFLSETDKSKLTEAAKWMKRVVKITESHPAAFMTLDTYANLLYKLGRRTKAVKMEKRSVRLVEIGKFEDLIVSYRKTLNQMINGEPTYLDNDAIWDGIVIKKR